MCQGTLIAFTPPLFPKAFIAAASLLGRRPFRRKILCLGNLEKHDCALSGLVRPPAREGDRLFPHDVATGSLSVRLIGNQRFPSIKLSHQNFSDRCPRIVRLFYSS